ncbi:MAG: hypothetical protein ACRD0P_23400 [Stackebrandtia sp.]
MDRPSGVPPAPVLAAFFIVLATGVAVLANAFLRASAGLTPHLLLTAMGTGVTALTALGLWRGGRRGGQAVAVAYGILTVLIGFSLETEGAWQILIALFGLTLVILVLGPGSAKQWFAYNRN